MGTGASQFRDSLPHRLMALFAVLALFLAVAVQADESHKSGKQTKFSEEDLVQAAKDLKDLNNKFSYESIMDFSKILASDPCAFKDEESLKVIRQSDRCRGGLAMCPVEKQVRFFHDVIDSIVTMKNEMDNQCRASEKKGATVFKDSETLKPLAEKIDKDLNKYLDGLNKTLLGVCERENNPREGGEPLKKEDVCSILDWLSKLDKAYGIMRDRLNSQDWQIEVHSRYRAFETLLAAGDNRNGTAENSCSCSESNKEKPPYIGNNDNGDDNSGESGNSGKPGHNGFGPSFLIEPVEPERAPVTPVKPPGNSPGATPKPTIAGLIGSTPGQPVEKPCNETPPLYCVGNPNLNSGTAKGPTTAPGTGAVANGSGGTVNAGPINSTAPNNSLDDAWKDLVDVLGPSKPQVDTAGSSQPNTPVTMSAGTKSPPTLNPLPKEEPAVTEPTPPTDTKPIEFSTGTDTPNGTEVAQPSTPTSPTTPNVSSPVVKGPEPVGSPPTSSKESPTQQASGNPTNASLGLMPQQKGQREPEQEKVLRNQTASIPHGSEGGIGSASAYGSGNNPGFASGEQGPGWSSSITPLGSYPISQNAQTSGIAHPSNSSDKEPGSIHPESPEETKVSYDEAGNRLINGKPEQKGLWAKTKEFVSRAIGNVISLRRSFSSYSDGTVASSSLGTSSGSPSATLTTTPTASAGENTSSNDGLTTTVAAAREYGSTGEKSNEAVFTPQYLEYIENLRKDVALIAEVVDEEAKTLETAEERKLASLGTLEGDKESSSNEVTEGFASKASLWLKANIMDPMKGSGLLSFLKEAESQVSEEGEAEFSLSPEMASANGPESLSTQTARKKKFLKPGKGISTDEKEKGVLASLGEWIASFF